MRCVFENQQFSPSTSQTSPITVLTAISIATFSKISAKISEVRAPETAYY